MAYKSTTSEAFYVGTQTMFNLLAATLTQFIYPNLVGFLLPVDMTDTCLGFTSPPTNYAPLGVITSFVLSWGVYATVPDAKLLDYTPISSLVDIPNSPLPIFPKNWCTSATMPFTALNNALD